MGKCNSKCYSKKNKKQRPKTEETKKKLDTPAYKNIGGLNFQQYSENDYPLKEVKSIINEDKEDQNVPNEFDKKVNNNRRDSKNKSFNSNNERSQSVGSINKKSPETKEKIQNMLRSFSQHSNKERRNKENKTFLQNIEKIKNGTEVFDFAKRNILHKPKEYFLDLKKEKTEENKEEGKIFPNYIRPSLEKTNTFYSKEHLKQNNLYKKSYDSENTDPNRRFSLPLNPTSKLEYKKKELTFQPPLSGNLNKDMYIINEEKSDSRDSYQSGKDSFKSSNQEKISQSDKNNNHNPFFVSLFKNPLKENPLGNPLYQSHLNNF